MNNVTAQGTILHKHYFYTLDEGLNNAFIKNKILIPRGMSINDEHDTILIIAYDDIAIRINEEYKKGDLIHFRGKLRSDTYLKNSTGAYILIEELLYIDFK